jgi:hypothetical protein
MATRFDVSVTVASNRLPHLRAQGKRKASAAVRRAAFNTQRYAAPLTPVDTGALKANVIIDITGNGLSATVRWGQFYGVFQEFGTRRGIAPKRFAAGGAEKAFPRFQQDMSNIYGGGA